MTKCAAFWNHTNLRNDDRVFACCRFKEPIQKFNGDLDAVLHSKEYEILRNSDVETLPQCSKCLHEEQLGKQSLREKFNEQYSTNEIKLKYVEIGFDNICDLACDGCWDEWSHTWALKKNIPIKQAIKNIREITNLPVDLEKIVFLGGEPLMTNRHKKFLHQLSALDTVSVEYHTNGMHQIDNETHDLLSRCKQVNIIVSIDGYGKLNESVRSNSAWQTVSDFAISTREKYHTIVHTTIHKNNWHGLLELQDWIFQHQLAWSINVLTYPTSLDIRSLDLEHRGKILDIIKKLPEQQALCLINHLNS